MGIMEKKMETTVLGYLYPLSPFLGTLNSRCRIIIGIQKGTIILTTTHVSKQGYSRAPHDVEGLWKDLSLNFVCLKTLDA